MLLIIRMAVAGLAAALLMTPAFASEPEPPEPPLLKLSLEAAKLVQDPPQIDKDAPRRRIVSGRPKLYTFKRVINPLNWLAEPIEAVFLSAEHGRLRGLVEGISGPRKKAGVSFFLSGAGSGSGLGSGIRIFHENLFGKGIQFEIPLLITYRDYQVFEVNTKFPVWSDHRLDFEVRGAYRSRPKDNFFGIGNQSDFDDRTKFRSVAREALVGLTSEISEDWKTGLFLAYRNIGITDPIGVPSTQEVFSPALVPGLTTGAEFVSLIWSLDQDSRDNRRIPSSGGLRQVEFSLNESRGKGDFSFWKYRLDLQQFFSLDSTGRKVIALRGMFETNQENGGSQVPFFEMASLGGANTMRSLQNFRYYDKSGMAMLIEYRYRIWRAFDWVLFLEEGQVAPEPGDFAWDQFHTGYGFRFFIRATPTFPISFDVARGRDSWRVYFRFKPSF